MNGRIGKSRSLRRIAVHIGSNARFVSHSHGKIDPASAHSIHFPADEYRERWIL
jgi:hypothetical protein